MTCVLAPQCRPDRAVPGSRYRCQSCGARYFRTKSGHWRQTWLSYRGNVRRYRRAGRVVRKVDAPKTTSRPARLRDLQGRLVVFRLWGRAAR
jgi:hypothetical protein